MSADPRVIAALDSAGLGYQVLDCDPQYADTAEFCRVYGVEPSESANTIVIASRQPVGHNAACVALATTRLDVNGLVRRRLGVRKVSFASAEATKEITGMEIGGVTVPGLPEGLPIWVDGAVASTPSVVIGAGSRSAKIRMAGSDLLRLPGVEVVDGLAAPVG
jgi:prolyl-tRNA editing enzyme YbaK/EbsC (Cys-tRNA(Pro) deacylase)